MALPADLLASLAFDAVTNARASDDYHAGGSNWRIGSSSLLASALGLRASKDNFWTSNKANDRFTLARCEVNRARVPCVTPFAACRGQETSPYLNGIVCALSQGPVGFADPLWGTDPLVLWPTTTRNGTLLHASRPATAIDDQFTGA